MINTGVRFSVLHCYPTISRGIPSFLAKISKPLFSQFSRHPKPPPLPPAEAPIGYKLWNITVKIILQTNTSGKCLYNFT